MCTFHRPFRMGAFDMHSEKELEEKRGYQELTMKYQKKKVHFKDIKYGESFIFENRIYEKVYNPLNEKWNLAVNLETGTVDEFNDPIATYYLVNAKVVVK